MNKRLEGIAGYLRQGCGYWRSDRFPAVAAHSTTNRADRARGTKTYER